MQFDLDLKSPLESIFLVWLIWTLCTSKALRLFADGLSACLYDEWKQRGLHRSLQRPGSGAGCDRALHPAALRKRGPPHHGHLEDESQSGPGTGLSPMARLLFPLSWRKSPAPISHPCPVCLSAIMTVNLDHCSKFKKKNALVSLDCSLRWNAL